MWYRILLGWWGWMGKGSTELAYRRNKEEMIRQEHQSMHFPQMLETMKFHPSVVIDIHITFLSSCKHHLVV